MTLFLPFPHAACWGMAPCSSACRLEGCLLPHVRGASTSPCQGVWQSLQPCWLSGMSLCHWGGLLLFCMGGGRPCGGKSIDDGCLPALLLRRPSRWLVGLLANKCSWPEPTLSLSCLMRHYALRLGCIMLL